MQRHRERLRVVSKDTPHSAPTHARVREFVHRGVARMRVVPSADNISDFFTKVLAKEPFQRAIIVSS